MSFASGSSLSAGCRLRRLKPPPSMSTAKNGGTRARSRDERMRSFAASSFFSVPPTNSTRPPPPGSPCPPADRRAATAPPSRAGSAIGARAPPGPRRARGHGIPGLARGGGPARHGAQHERQEMSDERSTPRMGAQSSTAAPRGPARIHRHPVACPSGRTAGGRFRFKSRRARRTPGPGTRADRSHVRRGRPCWPCGPTSCSWMSLSAWHPRPGPARRRRRGP